MDIFESLENLPVSESCFEDIISIVERIIDESNYKVSDVLSAASNSMPTRMEKYKAVKVDPNSTPAQIKAASDRVDQGAAKLGYLRRQKGNLKMTNDLKNSLKDAGEFAVLSPKEKQERIDQVIQNSRMANSSAMWNTQPSCGKYPSGRKYPAMLSVDR